jgi:nitrite reductase (cytochrome c-552)
MINRSCVTCHPYGENELKARVEGIQDRHFALMSRAGKATVEMLDAIVEVRRQHDDRQWREATAKDPALKEVAELQRAAQWRLDFVAAENSMGFHAPQEMARILAESIDLARQAQVKAAALRRATPASAPATPAP